MQVDYGGIPCTTAFFLVLPDYTLNEILNLLNSVIATLEAKIIWIEERLITLEFIMAPLLAKRAMIENFAQSVKSQLDIIPAAAASGCPQLGEVRQTVNDSLNDAMAGLHRVMGLLDHSQALRLWYHQHRDLVRRQINFIKDIRDRVIDVQRTRAAAITAASIVKGAVT